MKVLFEELLKTRVWPLNLRNDGVMDLWAIGNWYELCQDTAVWSDLCSRGVAQHRGRSMCAANVITPTTCNFSCICGRQFRRKGDLTRHHFRDAV